MSRNIAVRLILALGMCLKKLFNKYNDPNHSLLFLKITHLRNGGQLY